MGTHLEAVDAKGKRVHVWIGTSGWSYPHWRGRFYPEDWPPGRWFEYYARHFSTVEINRTFYQLPSEQAFKQWRDQAPQGFLYAVKANRYLTHVRRLQQIDEPLERFVSRARLLGGHLGPVLFQLPPRWKRDLDRLERFLKAARGIRRRVVEFRDSDWLVPETFRLLRRYRTALCIHDMIKPHPRVCTAPMVYLRFHGAGERYGGCYPREELCEWAEWITEVVRGGRNVFAYFNNDAEAYAVRNALELTELVRERLGCPP